MEECADLVDEAGETIGDAAVSDREHVPDVPLPQTETLSLPHAEAKTAVENLARDAAYDPDTMTFAPRRPRSRTGSATRPAGCPS